MAEAKVMRALLRNAPISPQKVRRTAASICGLDVSRALDELEFSPLKAARILRKVVDSAVSNAENNHATDLDGLIVTLVRVDKGLALTRFETRARGRYGIRIKLRSNIEVRVGHELDPGHTRGLSSDARLSKKAAKKRRKAEAASEDAKQRADDAEDEQEEQAEPEEQAAAPAAESAPEAQQPAQGKEAADEGSADADAQREKD